MRLFCVCVTSFNFWLKSTKAAWLAWQWGSFGALPGGCGAGRTAPGAGSGVRAHSCWPLALRGVPFGSLLHRLSNSYNNQFKKPEYINESLCNTT